MMLALALLEGSVVLAAASAMIFLWCQHTTVTWANVAGALGKGSVLSLGYIAAFYYNHLYDLRIVRSFPDFASRLLQSVGVAFIMLAVFYTVFPGTKIADGPFLSSLLIIVGFLLPLRAVWYGVMRRRSHYAAGQR
jgi:hypothetical protein